MASIRKKLLAKPAPAPKALGLTAAGKGKPAPKKPAEKPAAKPGHAPSTAAKARSSSSWVCDTKIANWLADCWSNFLCALATPEPIKDWSLTSLKEKLIKIGAKVVSHGRYVAFQMAEVAIPRQMFQEILRLIAELRPQPPPALA